MLTFRFFAATIIGASVALGVSAKSGSCQSLPPLDPTEVYAGISIDSTATLVSGSSTYDGVTLTVTVGTMSLSSEVGACFSTDSNYGGAVNGEESPGSYCNCSFAWSVIDNTFFDYNGECEYSLGMYASAESNAYICTCYGNISDGNVSVTAGLTTTGSDEANTTSYISVGSLIIGGGWTMNGAGSLDAVY